MADIHVVVGDPQNESSRFVGVKLNIDTGSRLLRTPLGKLTSTRRSSVCSNARIIHYKLYLSSSAKRPDATRIFQKFLSSASSTTVDKPVHKQPQLIGKALPVKETAEEEEDAEVWQQQKVELKLLPGYYARLAKIRLTGMVVLTAMAGYALAPEAIHMDTFMWMSIGTLLCSSSANAINQWLEIPFDSQMARTKNRVLVRGLLSPSHVLTFGIVTGAIGITTLLTQVNALTALLGGANLLLYTSIYTPLKRISIINTWMGSIVGGIPPLMGWAACTGTLDPGALVLAGILYSWQFPHFNALSWNLRQDYSRAGYRMMCVTDPALCRRVALRHSLYLIGLSTLLPLCDVTSWWLALDSLPLNTYFTWLAWKFYRNSDSKSSRELFRFSLLHLPVLMLLIMFHKKPKKNSRDVIDTLEVTMET